MTTKPIPGEAIHAHLEELHEEGHSKDCKGFGTAFLDTPAAINRILTREDEGFRTVTPGLHGTMVKVVHYDPKCGTCNSLAFREFVRQDKVQRR